MEYVNCNLCGADDAEVLYASTLDGTPAAPAPDHFACTNHIFGVHPPIVRCRRCSLVYANPRISGDEALARYAAVVDEAYVRERAGREATFQRHLDHLESLIQPEGPHKLLDVGSHIGVFVQEARARGWDAHGLEPSAWAVEQAHAHGVPVIQGTLADVDPGREFDVVTLWDVIEHLADPLHELQRVAAIVRPGGWVCVHTMDVDSPFARLAGSRWPWFMQMHLYYFSRATLTAMLSRAGFRTVRAAARGRVLRLGYLVSRLTPYSQQLAGRIETAARALHLTRRLVPVNFGDLFTACARKE